MAITPEPRANLVRYHGTLAPNARLRSSIVPRAAKRGRAKNDCASVHGAPADESAAGEPVRKDYSWADLVRRVFETDGLECARCHGRLSLIATIAEPSVIQRMLVWLGLPARPPLLAPARGLWQGELDFADA